MSTLERQRRDCLRVGMPPYLLISPRFAPPFLRELLSHKGPTQNSAKRRVLMQ